MCRALLGLHFTGSLATTQKKGVETFCAALSQQMALCWLIDASLSGRRFKASKRVASFVLFLLAPVVIALCTAVGQTHLHPTSLPILIYSATQPRDTVALRSACSSFVTAQQAAECCSEVNSVGAKMPTPLLRFARLLYDVLCNML